MDATEERVLVERVTRLEVIAEHTAKTLALLQQRMDDGFRDVRSDINSNFRWTVGIYLTTLLAVIGVMAKSGRLF